MTEAEKQVPTAPKPPIPVDIFRLAMVGEGLKFAVEHLENARRLLHKAPGPFGRALAKEVGKAASRAERAAALVRKAIEADAKGGGR